MMDVLVAHPWRMKIKLISVCGILLNRTHSVTQTDIGQQACKVTVEEREISSRQDTGEHNVNVARPMHASYSDFCQHL
jgi:hypothetical protein